MNTALAKEIAAAKEIIVFEVEDTTTGEVEMNFAVLITSDEQLEALFAAAMNG
jgi:hypothetical protein